MQQKSFMRKVSLKQVPRNIKEAMLDEHWKMTVYNEMKALQDNNTWELTTLPYGKKTVGCKWVFTVKYKIDGTVEWYKTRLVAKGYTQIYSTDYQETFTPIAKLNTIWILKSLAANLDWPLHQFDVKNAFLHVGLEEEVYMDVPYGFTGRT